MNCISHFSMRSKVAKWSTVLYMQQLAAREESSKAMVIGRRFSALGWLSACSPPSSGLVGLSCCTKKGSSVDPSAHYSGLGGLWITNTYFFSSKSWPAGGPQPNCSKPPPTAGPARRPMRAGDPCARLPTNQNKPRLV